MAKSEQIVTVEVEIDGEREVIELSGFALVPRIGEEVRLDYWHGRKLTFIVDHVRHHIANSGHDMIQQTVLVGRPI